MQPVIGQVQRREQLVPKSEAVPMPRPATGYAPAASSPPGDRHNEPATAGAPRTRFTAALAADMTTARVPLVFVP